MSAQKQYSLRYLPLFWDDMASAVLYLTGELKNPDAADRLIDKVEEGILKYVEHPEMAPIYRTAKEREHPYHWFAVGNYMVFYVVVGDVMEVRRLVYGARDLTKVLP